MRDYSLQHIGRVRTLLEAIPRRPATKVNGKVRRVWGGPLSFAGSPDLQRPYVVLMFVRDLAGKVTFENPQDVGAGETDWWLYREGIRLEMDAVGGGATTLRGSGITFSLYDPELVRFRTSVLEKPRHPVQVIFSGSGRLDADGEYVLAVPEFTTVVVTSAPGAQRIGPALLGRENKHVMTAGPDEQHVNLVAGLRELRTQFGVERMLVVGGAHVATALLEARLVDELFLTDAPRLLGGQAHRTFYEGRPFTPETAPRARLTTVKIGVRDNATFFRRYRLTE